MLGFSHLMEIPHMLSNNPLEWVDPQYHYEMMETQVGLLSPDALLEIRKNYDHIDAFSWTIAAVALPATATIWVAAASHISPELAVLSLGAVPAVPSILGGTRHNIREGERNILDEELARRGIVYENKNPRE